MSLELTLVKKEEKIMLEKLLQLYLHDLSLSFPIEFDSTRCEYEYDLDKYFNDNYAYFIKSNDNILGFVLVDDNDADNYEISEMFVLNNYKGQKIGERASELVFDKHKGNWTIRVVPLSPKAEAFWIKTVKKYMDENYKLKHTGKYNRAELYFSNKSAKSKKKAYNQH